MGYQADSQSYIFLDESRRKIVLSRSARFYGRWSKIPNLEVLLPVKGEISSQSSELRLPQQQDKITRKEESSRERERVNCAIASKVD